MKKNLFKLRALLVVAFLTFLSVMPVLAVERQYEWTNVARIVAIGKAMAADGEVWEMDSEPQHRYQDK